MQDAPRNTVEKLRKSEDTPIIDNILIGSHIAAYNYALIKHNIFSCVINCAAEEVDNYLEDLNIPHLELHFSKYKNYAFENEETALSKIFKRIDTAIMNQDCLLIYSVSGESRCAIVMASYLVWKFNWFPWAAMKLIAAMRPCINPKSEDLRLFSEWIKRNFNQNKFKNPFSVKESELTMSEILLKSQYLLAIGAYKETRPVIRRKTTNKNLHVKWTDDLNEHKQSSYKLLRPPSPGYRSVTPFVSEIIEVNPNLAPARCRSPSPPKVRLLTKELPILKRKPIAPPLSILVANFKDAAKHYPNCSIVRQQESLIKLPRESPQPRIATRSASVPRFSLEPPQAFFARNFEKSETPVALPQKASTSTATLRTYEAVPSSKKDDIARITAKLAEIRATGISLTQERRFDKPSLSQRREELLRAINK